MKVLNIEMHDGSRHFGDLPQTILWYELRTHIKKLEGAEITGFITGDVTEAWTDFSYRGHHFSVTCPDEILESVLSHCELVLGVAND